MDEKAEKQQLNESLNRQLLIDFQQIKGQNIASPGRDGIFDDPIHGGPFVKQDTEEIKPGKNDQYDRGIVKYDLIAI